MDDYPCWDELGPADRLRIAALEAEGAWGAGRFLDAVHAAADLLERLGSVTGEEGASESFAATQSSKDARKYSERMDGSTP